MKLEVTKEWCLAMARREGNAEVGAGAAASDPERDEASDAAAAPSVRVDEPQVAFGPFVQLMRRKQGLTIEKLAEEADLDLSELVIIEKEPHYRPEPRTVHQLASVFKVPTRRLLELSGNAVAKDVRFRQEAVRFAARSGPINKLTPEETAALERFVKFLSDDK